MSVDPHWRTLREIDSAVGRSKGAAFRVFKRLAPHHRDGQDYTVLDHEAAAAAIGTLRATQRVYANAVNVVLLSPSFARAVLAELSGGVE